MLDDGLLLECRIFVRQVEIDDRDVFLQLLWQDEARQDEDDVLQHEAAL